MRFFIDTEFIDDGRTIDLLSIAIVCEDGREYYAEPAEADRDKAGQWVQANVLPHLKGPVKPRRIISDEVLTFLHSGGKDNKAELWGWYSAYDHVALAQLWGPMAMLPNGVPMLTHDLRSFVCEHMETPLPPKPAIDHHALEDARWIRDVFNVVFPGALPTVEPVGSYR